MVATRCRRLIGRHAELGALITSLDQAEGAESSAGVTFLVGEPGVGKSRLAMELAERAAARGFTVLVGRAAQASNPVPLRPIVEALIGIARTTPMPEDPALAQYRPALASIVPGWREPTEPTGRESEPEISPLILGEALLQLLTVLADVGSLLVLEDLQYADPETLAIVEYLADNLRDGRVRCVVTVQESEPSSAMATVHAIHARRAASLIDVPRLSDAEIGEMAAVCLDQDEVPDPVLRRLLNDCDGLPFAVEEILAAAIFSGELVQAKTAKPAKPGQTSQTIWSINPDVTTGVPISIAESVRRRLTNLGPRVADVVVTAAVLGRQFDWTLLPRLTGTAEAHVLAALRRACDVQLIEPQGCSQVVFRFRHSLTRNAIVSNLLPPDLARRSAKAAEAIEAVYPGLPGPWCELAAELHETADQPVQAATVLLEAGRRALGRGALTSAGTSLRRASAMVDQARTTGSEAADPQLRVLIDEALTSVHMLAGDCDELTKVAERLLAELDAAGTPPAAKAVIRLNVARSLSEGDRVASAEQQVAAARQLAEQSPDPELDGWTDAVAARCAIDGGDPDRAFALARRGLAAAEAVGLAGHAAEAACEALEVIGRWERARDTATANAAFWRAYQIASASGLPVRRIRAMHELGTIEMLEEGGSRRLCEARSLAVESGAISVATVIDLQLANAWSLGADLGQALDAAHRSQRAARKLDMRRVEAMAICAEASILATGSDQVGVEPAAERAQAVVPGDPGVLTSTWGEVRVTAAIIGNDLPAALDSCATGVSYARTEPLTAPCMAWGYWPLLRAVVGQDGHDALAESKAAGAEVAFWNRGCLAYAEAVLAGQDRNPDLAAQHAERGRGYFARCAPWWNHIFHRLIAEEAFKNGWGQPAQWMREAIGDLEAAGLSRLASACRGVLRHAGERVPRSGRGNACVPSQLRNLGVTSREMDVYLLVAQGISTAEIATRLVISPKTVETHIANLVAKTGQSGRRELVAHAARSCQQT